MQFITAYSAWHNTVFGFDCNNNTCAACAYTHVVKSLNTGSELEHYSSQLGSNQEV